MNKGLMVAIAMTLLFLGSIIYVKHKAQKERVIPEAGMCLQKYPGLPVLIVRDFGQWYEVAIMHNGQWAQSLDIRPMIAKNNPDWYPVDCPI